MTTTRAYSASQATTPLSSVTITRREPKQKFNEAWECVLKQDVQYRFVIDMKSLQP